MFNLLKKNTLSQIITKNCKKYNLEPKIIYAIIEQESNFNTFAYRYEPAFYEKYLENKLPYSLGGVFNSGISLASEIRMRAFSFGLMQVMGQTARENGFGGYLPELFDAEINVNLGCLILRKNLDYFKGDLLKALSAYNSGIGFVTKHGATQYGEDVVKKSRSKEILKKIGE